MLLNAAVSFVKFIQHMFFRFLTISYEIGAYICGIFESFFCLIYNCCKAIITAKNKTYHFFCDVEKAVVDSLYYAADDINYCIHFLLDAGKLFARGIYDVATGTKTLATCLAEFWNSFTYCLLRGFHLLVDFCWWLIWLLPRFIYWLIITLILLLDNIIMCFITGTTRMLYEICTNVMPLLIVFILTCAILQYRYYIGFYLQTLLAEFLSKLQPTVRRAFYLTKRHWLAAISFANAFKKTTAREEQEDASLPTASICITCCEREKCVLLLPCRHLCMCQECLYAMLAHSTVNHCPMCRTHIQSTLRVYT